MTNQSQHRQDRFYHHPDIPLAAMTKLQVGWMPVFLGEPIIGKDDHLFSNTLNQVLECRAIVHIGCITVPSDDQADMIQQETQLSAHDPTAIGLAFAPNLFLALSFSARMNQLNAIGVNHAYHRRSGHKRVNPSAMRVEQSKQTCAFRQLWEQIFAFGLDTYSTGESRAFAS